MKFDPPLDKGIEKPMRVLHDASVETYESCEGGPGHSYPEPTILRLLTLSIQGGTTLTKRFSACAIATVFSLDVVAFGTASIVVMHRLLDRMEWSCLSHFSLLVLLTQPKSCVRLCPRM